MISGSSAASILQYVHNQVKVDAEADVLMEAALGPNAFYWYQPPLWVQSDSPTMVELSSSTASMPSADDSTDTADTPSEAVEDLDRHGNGTQHPETEMST